MKTPAKTVAARLRHYLAVLADRLSVRALAHRLILSRHLTDAQIMARLEARERKIGGPARVSHRARTYPGNTLVSWYRSELGRLGFPMASRARKGVRT